MRVIAGIEDHQHEDRIDEGRPRPYPESGISMFIHKYLLRILRCQSDPAVPAVSGQALIGRMRAANGLDHVVELLQETGSVIFLHRRRPAGDLAGRAQPGQQLPRCDGRTDVVFRKRFASRSQHTGTFFQAAAGKGNVRRDHDVVRLHVFRNPIIGRVESVPDDFKGDPAFVGHAHPGIGHQGDIQLIAVGHTIDFFFDGAGIRIDNNMEQIKILAATPDRVRMASIITALAKNARCPDRSGG